MDALRSLAIDLYQRCRSNEGNLLVSPYSIWLALAMLHPGARGTTREQLSTRLGIENLDPVVALTRELATRAESTASRRQGGFGFHLEVANKLWVQTGYRISVDYAQALASAFGVDPAPVDFKGSPALACDAINRWVSDQTHERITKIVSPSTLAADLRAVLANAIYFKAGWANVFKESDTLIGPFYLLDGSVAQTPIMRRTGQYAHSAEGDLRAIELRYVQPDVSMVVILPNAGTFEAADRTLTLAQIDRLIGKLERTEVELELPSFKFKTSLELVEALCALGMDSVFSPTADLSAISDEPGVSVGEVLHETFIAVDERGTEAAAVTAMMLLAAGVSQRPEPVPFHIDRPFYVLIRDIPTGTPLFFGRVLDPRAG